MSYDYKLANEMYGTPWSVDLISFNTLSSILKDIRSGVVMDLPERKLNSIDFLEIKNETRIVKDSWNLKSSDSFDGIGIINLNGPITKNGGQSTQGTKQMSSQMMDLHRDSRVKGFIILGDSGGGSTGAISLMRDAIKTVSETKPVYTLIEKGATLGSAAYAIAASGNGIFAENGMSIVGSAGTMIQLKAKPHGNVDSDGEKTITLYASKSIAKNKAFNEAINNDNYELIINELLDPINENFLSEMVSDRPMLKGTKFDDGHTVFSKDAIGTFIDGIASFDEVVNMILSDTNTNKGVSNNTNINSNTMTKEEFKAANPTGYAEIFSEAVEYQKEVVAGWAVFSKVAPEAVLEGIKSGLPIKDSEKSAFLLESTKAHTVASLLGDNIKPIATGQTETSETDESVEQKEFNGLIKGIKLT